MNWDPFLFSVIRMLAESNNRTSTRYVRSEIWLNYYMILRETLRISMLLSNRIGLYAGSLNVGLEVNAHGCPYSLPDLADLGALEVELGRTRTACPSSSPLPQYRTGRTYQALRPYEEAELAFQQRPQDKLDASCYVLVQRTRPPAPHAAVCTSSRGPGHIISTVITITTDVPLRLRMTVSTITC